ncbi:MAG: GNAT family N-acetyltransferase [Deltaproteobacteria bacterium]|nr:GNAT family N-acetyltransferase [Deltaproteobacteria bacterium]MBW2538324.1 GNAT family N-acetyltransferase [Deltaproteobacteria bacterium]
MSTFELKAGYLSGVIGRVTELHASYYHEHWSFGPFFEAKVASEMAEFITRYDSDRDGLWTVLLDDHIEGSIIIDGLQGKSKGAHLRWFITSDAIRGKGAGSRLVREAMTFCRAKKYSRVYLWTFKGLEAARHLYEKAGFKLVEQHFGENWGQKAIEQRFEAVL